MKLKLLFISILLVLNATAEAYVPTNFTGPKDEVRNLFSSLWSDFKSYDNTHCYRRAHVLAHQMDSKKINSMKAFFFRGDKLTSLKWWYHVAPMVYYQGAGVVLDRGLLEGATFLEDWLLALSDGKQCREIQSMRELRGLKPQEYCLYMIVPMYYYGPLQLEDLNMDRFVMEDLQDMLNSIPGRKQRQYLESFPLTDI